VVAELKTDSGRTRAAQASWVEALGDAGQDVYALRPTDWRAIVGVLEESRSF